MKSRRFFNRRNSHLWYSWFQAKRATLALSDAIVSSSYDDHFATLSKSDSGDEVVIDSIFKNTTFNNVIQKLARDVKADFDLRPSFHKFYPSGSACFEATRKMGGQHGHLCSTVSLGQLSSHIDSSELWSMTDVGRDFFTGFNAVQEKRVSYGLEVWNLLPGLVDRLDDNRRLRCTIQAVLEPNKVRIISKGEASYYYSQRPLQKSLHTSMRSMPCFRLIGRTLFPTDISDIARRATSTDQWFSIDYSAATDGLSYKYSGRILELLTRYLPSRERKLASLVLGPHDLYYPNLDAEKAEFVDGVMQPVPVGAPVYRGVQKNGQLMGSILSFPILCLANLGVYLLNMQEHQKTWTHEDRLNHVLVNGDDMVYAAPKDLWASHIKIGRSVGLEMSVGKAYTHYNYLNINSTSIHCNLRSNHRSPFQIDYLNSGLFFGQHKVQGPRCEDSLETSDSVIQQPTYAAEHSRAKKGIVENINWLLQGVRPGHQSDILKLLLLLQKDGIRHECLSTIERGKRVSTHNRNLFIPKHFGGMGVVPPVDWRYKVTITDRKIASNLVFEKQSSHRVLDTDTQRPLRGFEVDKLDCSGPSPWARCVTESVMPVFSDAGFPSIRKERLKYGSILSSTISSRCCLVSNPGQSFLRVSSDTANTIQYSSRDSWSEYVCKPMAHYAEGINLHQRLASVY
jgi:hypothetical protein